MAARKMFRVAFLSHGKVYELYCKSIVSSSLWGFLEISGLVFDRGDTVLVDPAEEKLRKEFEGVQVLHLPMHGVLRVEEVAKKGPSLIRDSESGEKVTPFPLPPASRQ